VAGAPGQRIFRITAAIAPKATAICCFIIFEWILWLASCFLGAEHVLFCNLFLLREECEELDYPGLKFIRSSRVPDLAPIPPVEVRVGYPLGDVFDLLNFCVSAEKLDEHFDDTDMFASCSYTKALR